MKVLSKCLANFRLGNPRHDFPPFVTSSVRVRLSTANEILVKRNEFSRNAPHFFYHLKIWAFFQQTSCNFFRDMTLRRHGPPYFLNFSSLFLARYFRPRSTETYDVNVIFRMRSLNFFSRQIRIFPPLLFYNDELQDSVASCLILMF